LVTTVVRVNGLYSKRVFISKTVFLQVDTLLCRIRVLQDWLAWCPVVIPFQGKDGRKGADRPFGSRLAAASDLPGPTAIRITPASARRVTDFDKLLIVVIGITPPSPGMITYLGNHVGMRMIGELNAASACSNRSCKATLRIVASYFPASVITQNRPYVIT
jgi:hypothetical protein